MEITNLVFITSSVHVQVGATCQNSEYEICVSKCVYFVVTCNLRVLGLVFFSLQIYVGLEALMANKCIKILSCDQPRKVGCKTNGLETRAISTIDG